MEQQFAIVNAGCTTTPLALTVEADNTIVAKSAQGANGSWAGSQRWMLQFISTKGPPPGTGSGGQYAIINVGTGLALKCPPGQQQQLVVDNLQNSKFFSWDVAQVQAGDQEYHLAAYPNNQWARVDLEDDFCTDGQEVWAYGPNDTNAQKWLLQEISPTAHEVIVSVVNNVFTYSVDGAPFEADPTLDVNHLSQITFVPTANPGWKFSAFAIAPMTYEEDIGVSDFTIQVSGDKVVVRDRHLFNGNYKYTVAVMTPDGAEHIGDPKIVNRDAPDSR